MHPHPHPHPHPLPHPFVIKFASRPSPNLSPASLPGRCPKAPSPRTHNPPSNRFRLCRQNRLPRPGKIPIISTRTDAKTEPTHLNPHLRHTKHATAIFRLIALLRPSLLSRLVGSAHSTRDRTLSDGYVPISLRPPIQIPTRWSIRRARDVAAPMYSDGAINEWRTKQSKTLLQDSMHHRKYICSFRKYTKQVIVRTMLWRTYAWAHNIYSFVYPFAPTIER